MIIENNTFLLRPTKDVDLNFVLEVEKAKENNQFIIPYTFERHQQAITSNKEEHLVIIDKDQEEKVGFVLLGKDEQNKSLEFRRMVVNPKGKGIGRQCLQMIKKYCFEHLKYHRLWLDVFDFNHRAIHLYRSEGFVEEGKLIECFYRRGEFHNLIIFSMLRSEY